MGYAPILFGYYNQVSGLCQLMGGYLTLALPYKGDGITGMGSGAGGIGYNGAARLPRCEGDMLVTDGRADWRRPLEQGLDLSAMAVPLYWAEGGQVARVCGSRISLEDVITWYRMGCTAEMICEDYPWLELGDIYMVIAYYLRNKKEVHAHLRETSERADAGWADMAANGVVSAESYKAYCESRAQDWFNAEC